MTDSSIYTGGTLARLEIAKAALYPPRPEEGFLPGEHDPAGALEPVLHAVVISDRGTHYRYERGDLGGLSETVETVSAPAGDLPTCDVEVEIFEGAPLPSFLSEVCDGEVAWDDDYAQANAGNLFPKTDDAPVRKSQSECFRRRFDHDLARLLRREGVAVAALAEHFGVVKKSMYAVLVGVKPNGVLARARFDKLAAIRMREQGIPTVGIAANLGANINTLHAFFDRVPATGAF